MTRPESPRAVETASQETWFQFATRSLPGLVPVDLVSIAVGTGESAILTPIIGEDIDGLDDAVRSADSAATQAARSQQTQVATAASDAPDVRLLRAAGLLSVAVVPLLGQAQSLGVLIAARREEHWFTSEDIALLDTAASVLTVSLQKHQIEGRSQAIVETSMDALITTDNDGAVIDWNPRAIELLGWPAEAAAGKSVVDLIIPSDMRRDVKEGLRMAGSHAVARSAREHALLRDREEQLAVAQRAAKLGSWRVDLQINAHEASTSTLGMLGLVDPSEFDVNKFAVGAAEDDKVRVERALTRLTGEGRSFRLDFRYRTPDGKERFLALSGDAVLDANGTLLGCAGGCQDLTERKMRDDQLRFLTSYDPVTGLANRSLFEEHVESAVRHDAAQGEQSAVIVLTMPNLRLDTVTVGARGADRVVQEIGARLSHIAADWVRPASGDGPPPVVARIGEHEFGLVVRQVPDLADLGDLVTAIQYAASQPVTVETRTIAMTTAAGVAIHPQDGPSASALIAAAGHAARTAEQSGMGTWHFFDISQQVAARRRLSVVTRLRDALEKGEIDLALQAKFDAVGREICGFEALARLKSEDGKSISPAEFVPVAESIGVIDRLSDWVFDRVAQIYLQSGLEVPPIAANLSPVQLGRPGIAERILSRLAECGVATNNVQVEVTESALLDHPDIAVSELDTLRSHGVSIALDDFGTGYASLSTLHQLPIDILKIDRTFIMEVDTDSRAATVVRSVVQLAHGLGIEVVAEGVETARQADVLTEMEVDQLQGFWLARPAPIEDALSLIGADPGRG